MQPSAKTESLIACLQTIKLKDDGGVEFINPGLLLINGKPEAFLHFGDESFCEFHGEPGYDFVKAASYDKISAQSTYLAEF